MTVHDSTIELAASPRADTDLVAMLESLFADYRSKRGEPTATVNFDAVLWQRLDDLGLTRLTGDESRGGSGASWVEASVLLGAAAGAAAPVPLAEHDLLGGWLLEVADLSEGGGLRTVCQPDDGGLARTVPWARSATSIVALWKSDRGWRVADVPAASLSVTHARNLAGEPCDSVRFDICDLEDGADVSDDTAALYRLRGALARCAQAAGGIARVVEIVLAYVDERVQFGRPIGKFQAVQSLVADLAAEAALARAATDVAVARVVTTGWNDPGTPFTIGVAKSCVGHASSVVVRNAHQVLGALGTTLEHELPMLTKSILVHRSDFGSVHEWDTMLTDLSTEAGRDGLWPLITSRSDHPTA
ncbi:MULTISPECIES: acyl-CoA dehydrogenase family protein [unclassified Rhodococcus (in: high G+C Gram-positive bacteria)]|uniref:acyl-CoA dehydrogenase family protein n=1 Tax=unclassified Rhodococcus (in: high G+C Gram-positive bacteria) TaxID=192944 RepID=UPI000A5B29C4|nr:acyl-CoA dehydrogenase family protein [Rhodococcus sp. M8]